MNDLAGIVLDLDERKYHKRPEFSSTQARQVLELPALYQYRLTHPEPHKDAYDLGTAVHTKVLGTGSTIVTYPDEHLTPSGAVSTKAATVAWVEKQRSSGKVILSPARAALSDAMAEAVLAHPTARALFEQDGHAEASVFAEDSSTGVDVRARFDFLPNRNASAPVAVDLKTTGKSASPAGFAKSVADYGYHVQQGHYLDALENVTGTRLPMRFVVVETDAPHFVAVHELDDHFADIGRERAQTARETLAECRASGIWPGYGEEVTTIAPPMWLVYQQLDQEEEISI